MLDIMQGGRLMIRGQNNRVPRLFRRQLAQVHQHTSTIMNMNTVGIDHRIRRRYLSGSHLINQFIAARAIYSTETYTQSIVQGLDQVFGFQHCTAVE